MNRTVLGAAGEVERAVTRQQFLSDAVALLSSSLDYNTTLTSLANLAVPQIADWCTIEMLDDDGSISTLAVAHVDPAKVEYARQLQERFPADPEGPHGVHHVIRTGESEMVREIDNDLLEALVLDQEMLAIIRELGLCSSMTVPLNARGQTLGAITLVAAESGHRFDEDDLSLAEDLANRAALTIDNARLYRQAQRVAAEQTAVMERIADALVIVNTAEKITFVNGMARRYFGSGIAGQSIDTAVDMIRTFTWDGRPHAPSDRPSRRALRGETVIDLEWMVILPDGAEVYLQGSASPVDDEDGTRIGAVVAFRDVTERRRADEARGRLAAIVESSGDAIVGKTLDGIITSWNRAAERLYGYGCEEVLGRSVTLLAPDRADEISSILQWVRLGERVDQFETVRRRKDGQTIDVSLTVSPIVDSVGGIIGASAIARDITEQKRADEELRRLGSELEQRVVERTIELESANKELESFAYSVSHDLRAPLRSMDGFSQVLVERYADHFDERGTRYLTHIRDAAQEMGHLIDALLQLSRVTRSEMQRERLDLSALARSIEAQLRQTDSERDITLGIAESLSATGDGQLVKVMLENLLGNAWKFSRTNPHACIEFGISPGDSVPVFFVRDNGAGFDMTYANKLFMPFQRLHTTSHFEGTGIGLATVQRIVRRHGGRIWAESAVGQGSTFYFTLEPDEKGAT